jgi:hypothetical protein
MSRHFRLSPDERALARLISSLADCDPRTAALALREGADRIRYADVRERVQRAMADLGAAPDPAGVQASPEAT